MWHLYCLPSWLGEQIPSSSSTPNSQGPPPCWAQCQLVPFDLKGFCPWLEAQSPHAPRSILAAENAPARRGNGLPHAPGSALEITHPPASASCSGLCSHTREGSCQEPYGKWGGRRQWEPAGMAIRRGARVPRTKAPDSHGFLGGAAASSTHIIYI